MCKHHAIYMRASTKRQDTASQQPELRRWAQSHEGDSCLYHDSYTDTSIDRPGSRRLIEDVETGQVGTLVVWRLDRLGRTAKGLASLFEDLIRWKVNLIGLKDAVDLLTPDGRLMANILAAVAAYETEVRAERNLAGQAVARERGVRWRGSIRGPSHQGHGRTDCGDPALGVGGWGDRRDRDGRRALSPDDLSDSWRVL
jgi:DNA invertase Pin-like site-specific DNA recombinase